VNSLVDIHPARTPVGATLTVNWVGRTFDNASGFGRYRAGNTLWLTWPAATSSIHAGNHRINLRLENLFDEAYATGHSRGFTDVGASPYLVGPLGMPRTLHVSYSFSY
jgi:hypothetical protein